MKVEIYKAGPFGSLYNEPKEIKIDYLGYAEVSSFDEDILWDLCNWSCKGIDKPDNLKADIGVCNSDVIFKNPENNKFYIAKSFGWKMVDTMTEVKEHFDHYLTENFK